MYRVHGSPVPAKLQHITWDRAQQPLSTMGDVYLNSSGTQGAPSRNSCPQMGQDAATACPIERHSLHAAAQGEWLHVLQWTKPNNSPSAADYRLFSRLGLVNVIDPK